MYKRQKISLIVSKLLIHLLTWSNAMLILCHVNDWNLFCDNSSSFCHLIICMDGLLS